MGDRRFYRTCGISPRRQVGLSRPLPSLYCARFQSWRGGRVAEGARLESVYTGNRIVGSNPTLSANAFPKRFSRGVKPWAKGAYWAILPTDLCTFSSDMVAEGALQGRFSPDLRTFNQRYGSSEAVNHRYFACASSAQISIVTRLSETATTSS
jgi:hypothetical protein